MLRTEPHELCLSILCCLCYVLSSCHIVCSGSVVITAYDVESCRPGSNPEWGQYTVRLRSLYRAYPSLYPTLTISSNTTIQPVSSARNLGNIFDSNLSFSDHISYISKSCFSHIRDLRRIRNTLDHKTACTIATYLIHSKLDYCNSLYLNISNQQINRLQSFSTPQLVLSQKLQNSITLLLISNHFTGSKLRNAYNTKFFH